MFGFIRQHAEKNSDMNISIKPKVSNILTTSEIEYFY